MTRQKIFLLGATVVVLVVGLILATTWVYSAGQLQAMKGQAVYATPEDGTRELVARAYSGVDKVEIVHAGKVIFADLWFVEAHVWAAGRSDGKGFLGRDYDNPGWFFLRVPDGWVFVPEGKFPKIIAFGKWLYRLSG